MRPSKTSTKDCFKGLLQNHPRSSGGYDWYNIMHADGAGASRRFLPVLKETGDLSYGRALLRSHHYEVDAALCGATEKSCFHHRRGKQKKGSVGSSDPSTVRKKCHQQLRDNGISIWSTSGETRDGAIWCNHHLMDSPVTYRMKAPR